MHRLSFIFILWQLALPGLAQHTTIGLKSGLNLASQRLTVDAKTITPDGRIRMHGGVFIHSQTPGDWMAIQMEFLYSGNTHGNLMAATGSSSHLHDSYSFHYLNMPVLIQVYPASNFNLHIGPQMGFLVNVDASGNLDATHFKRVELAVAAGAEYYFTQRVGMGLRHIWGLSDVDSFTGDGIEGRKNRTLQLSLMYRFKKSNM
jgi:hypothetical protein